MDPISVVVITADPVANAGMASYLEDSAATILMPSERQAEADVCLLVEECVCSAAVLRMEQVARESRRPAPRMVVVADSVQKQPLLKAVHFGLSGVLPRKDANRERVIQAVIGAHNGRADFSPVMVAWLIEHLRVIQRDILSPRELTSSGLLSREVEVVKLLAEGLDTAEIAERLSYSERTVKNIIHGMLSRLDLRNRTHAVAHAVRHGVL
ncbi:helix-turn-helix transcriptional regulator [Streptomyces sp. NBC_01334]|uniref:helix-turn-helix transcriptional regulator n=1 Tax=Streptomyces sp. NBC_01334 TaxID=2903827 RepID=UPI002E141D79|nr:response regulator transcription factor [Streptomyces sp. NBC_01334]